MTFALIAAAVLFVLWVLMNLKTSRRDGAFIRNVHPYRRLMPYIMQGRNESIVFFDQAIDATELIAYLKQAKEQFGADVTHCTVAACAVAIAENPAMNVFVSGRRLYQRKQIELSFSLKRKQLDKKAKLSVIKKAMDPGQTFRAFCGEINEKIDVERSGERTYSDKEYDLFNLVPRPGLNLAVVLMRWLDYHNLLPYSFIEGDGMFASMFVANLGSLGMEPGYHHLYEWGNAPLFVMVGAIEERAVVVDGEVVVKPILPVRFSYDERIDDGLTANFGMIAFRRVLENPFAELGCLADDGSDTCTMGAHEE